MVKNLAKTRTKNPDPVLSLMATTVALHLAEKKPSPNHPKKNLRAKTKKENPKVPRDL